MPLNDLGFALIDIPALPDYVESFENLPLDEYCGGKHRFKRFSQYRMTFRSGWHFERLPHRPFVQPAAYNSFAGGVVRHYEPVLAEPFSYLRVIADSIPLDQSDTWQVDVHQNRIIATMDIAGVVVPEGPHRDGHEFAVVQVVRRLAITQGETFLLPLATDELFFRATIAEGTAIVFADNQLRHHTTEIKAVGPKGHRDVLIASFDRWKNKTYGPEWEELAGKT